MLTFTMSGDRESLRFFSELINFICHNQSYTYRKSNLMSTGQRMVLSRKENQ